MSLTLCWMELLESMVGSNLVHLFLTIIIEIQSRLVETLVFWFMLVIGKCIWIWNLILLDLYDISLIILVSLMVMDKVDLFLMPVKLKLNLLASKMSLHLLIMGKTFRKLCLLCKWFNLIFDYLTEGVPLIFPPPMRKLVINSFVWSMISRADALYVDSPVNCLPF